ncbi:MAG: hypothetical protein E7Z91_00745 [Cyanobacteria bacterium SIG30]|nr:hypothetical protein [Cyanobacteria bacterium SIG30]
MEKFIIKIIDLIFSFQEKKHKQKLEETFTSSSGIKTHITPHAKLEIKNKLLNEMRNMLNAHVTPIIKANVKTPEKLLDYIEKNGTKVYKINNADKILSAIGEFEGFITPIRGLKALYLNLILEKKVSFFTDEMFVLRDLPIDIYVMAHQFYKWYGWKIKMPGYDNKTQENFKKIWEFEKEDNVKGLTYNELANLKEAIQRDIEAIDFVINLAKENDGAKKGFENLQNGGADI